MAAPTTRPREPSPASKRESDFSDHSERQHNRWQDGNPTPNAPPTLHTLSATPFYVVARNERIANAIEFLRENHACTHDKWRWVRGPHQCEECRHVLRQYIFECRHCYLQACNRCRRNRL
ncbi:uncharacterized protein MYCFIDRAFT_203357 [Pseudocercospora fijiensis CIRAD86]|uniref:Uncharacterized protein n=1 Tax=Pseudocercospora fijiensis (strain CIRAD86) TaxID=383855 RepID=M3ADR0_PSEFD|nr:uncharacterized protein MYCFIDRAFT_203357 [Pseudocercospora fijiensis CIRAD86]EME82676.1 hypothetical protein MYCFIDRAFT_182595 [Pseudocercospora fijiensis CIRAD86]